MELGKILKCINSYSGRGVLHRTENPHQRLVYHKTFPNFRPGQILPSGFCEDLRTMGWYVCIYIHF